MHRIQCDILRRTLRRLPRSLSKQHLSSMMHLCPVLRFSPSEKVDPSLCMSSKIVLDRPLKSLDFWYIAPHDRDALTKLIIPYMAARLPRTYLLQSLLERHKWVHDMLGLPSQQVDDASLRYLPHVTTCFWNDPRRTIAKLLELSRMWFFTLLRDTYRMRFFQRSNSYESSPDIRDTGFWETEQYVSDLTESEVYRLTSIPNKYGATFYRNIYKRVKRGTVWKSFCLKIQAFCNSAGLFEPLEDPEQSLKDLQSNLTSIMSQRECLKTIAQLEKTAVLAHGTATYVKKFDERISVELQRQRAAWEKDLQCLRSKIEESEARSKSHTTPSTETTRSEAVATECPALEVLVTCRWLLEHLPDGNRTQQGFGNRWKLYWQKQWAEFKKEASGGDHPLRDLIGDAKYNKVGKDLYRTLSNFLHGYGTLRIKPLHPDVQKVVTTIKPLHYRNDGQIDLNLERKRWLVQPISTTVLLRSNPPSKRT